MLLKVWSVETYGSASRLRSHLSDHFREARAKLRRDAGGPLDDDATLLLMARHVLGGPIDDGRASYQIALTVCEACERATQTGHGGAVHVSAEVAEMASCDAQQIKGIHAESRSRRQNSTKDQTASIGDGGDETHVGSPFPGERRPPAAPHRHVAAQTFRGLRNLGFGEREARDAVRAAGAHVGSDHGVESLMRSALEQLTRSSWEKAS